MAILLQIFIGYCLIAMSSQNASRYGATAYHLEVPLGWLTLASAWMVVLLVILPAFLPRRISLPSRLILCDAIAFVLVFVPLAIFHIGVRGLVFDEGPFSPRLQEAQKEFGCPVQISWDSEAHIYFNRNQDPTPIIDALLRHGIGVKKVDQR